MYYQVLRVNKSRVAMRKLPMIIINTTIIISSSHYYSSELCIGGSDDESANGLCKLILLYNEATTKIKTYLQVNKHTYLVLPVQYAESEAILYTLLNPPPWGVFISPISPLLFSELLDKYNQRVLQNPYGASAPTLKAPLHSHLHAKCNSPRLYGFVID